MVVQSRRRPQSKSPDNLSMESGGSNHVLPLHKQHNSDADHSSSSSPTSATPRTRRRPKQFNSGSSSKSCNSLTNGYHDEESSLPFGNRELYKSNSTLPAWSANPQSPGEDGSGNSLDNNYISSPLSPSLGDGLLPYYFNSHGYHKRRMIQWPWTKYGIKCRWIVFGALFFAGMGYILQSRYSLVYSLEEVAQMVHNNYVLRKKLDDAEKGIKLLQRETTAYDIMRQQQQQQLQPSRANQEQERPPSLDDLRRNQPNNRALEEMQQLSDRLRVSQTRAAALQQRVQRLSKAEAIAKYGDHPHRVEIELSFPDAPRGHMDPGPTRFVIELAPLQLMPHSVHFFLELVSSQLLDGCSFILNALHVLKAAPLPYDGSSAANKARAFTRKGLESVAFKEYAASYPHEQYTVGFAADGSPSFYINTEDNSEIHLGDPCFGKIVEGFDTVKRLEASPTRNGIWFEQRIGIKRAIVLK